MNVNAISNVICTPGFIRVIVYPLGYVMFLTLIVIVPCVLMAYLLRVAPHQMTGLSYLAIESSPSLLWSLQGCPQRPPQFFGRNLSALCERINEPSKTARIAKEEIGLILVPP